MRRGLSHELLEWMDDPFVHGTRVEAAPTFLSNQVPPWRSALFGNGALCDPTLEVADPLEGGGSVFSAPSMVAQPVGRTVSYLLADRAFLSWFARQVPSTAVGGLYHGGGVFTGPAEPC